MTGGLMGTPASSTTIVDQNNPFTNRLAKNARASFGVGFPLIQAAMEGRANPFTETTGSTNDMIAKHVGERFGKPMDNPGVLNTGERYTMPDPTALSQAIQMYGMGSPSAGGVATTTTNTPKGPGVLDYAQLAATIAAIAGR